MHIRCAGFAGGAVFFRVFRDGEPVFTGLRDQCLRFVEVHREKARREVERLGRRRRGPFAAPARTAAAPRGDVAPG